MLIRRVQLNARSTASVELEKDVVPFLARASSA